MKGIERILIKFKEKIFEIFAVVLEIDDGSMYISINKRKKLFLFFGIYTFLFTAIFIIGYKTLWLQGKSLIKGGDGVNQHIVAMRYLGQYWRAIVRSILAGNFAVPMFDFRIGMGNDILQAIGAHDAVGDIFHLFTVFIPVRHTEIYYNFVAVIRPYLAGVTFSLLCMYAKRKNWAVLIGSLIYAFSGYVLRNAFQHPAFMIPLVYTPLILMGLDLILRRKKPFWFIMPIFLQALTGFYFLYMITIFMIIYAVIRVHHLHGKVFFRNLFPLALRVMVFYIIGLSMSAVVFLPVILGYFNSFRPGHINVDNLWFNSIPVYVNKLIFFIAPRNSLDYLSMAAVTLLAITALFVKNNEKKDKHHLLAFFLLALLLYIIPFGGLLMNGFGYVSGRWTFLFSVIMSFITVYMLPQMLFLGKREYTLIFVLMCTYCYLAVFKDSYRSVYSLMALAMLALNLFCICIFQKSNFASNNVTGVLKIRSLAAVLLTIAAVTINLLANIHYTYHGKLRNYASQYLLFGKYEERYKALPVVTESIKVTDNSFYRLDLPQTSLANAPLVLDYNGLTFYWSIINQYTTKGLLELENFNMNISFCNRRGFDGRTALNTLGSVKYFAKENRNNTKVPFGYTLLEDTGLSNQKIYENNYTLPLGYTYDKAVSYDEYQLLNTLDKQEAMLQAVALSADYSNSKTSNLQFTSDEISFNYTEDGLTWENGVLVTTESNASLTLSFEGQDNCETYVHLLGLDSNSLELMTLRINNTSTPVRFKKNNFYFGRHDYLCNLGYSEQGQTTAKIIFSKKGTYSLKSIKAYCYPMINYPQQVEALKEEPLKNIEMGINRVAGDISVSKDKFLVMSIPYSKGWSARVDVQTVELLQANTMFMAIPLTAGNHKIELTYCTPGIKLGAILSGVGFAVFIYLIVFRKWFVKSVR